MKQYLYAQPGSGAQGPHDEATLRRLLAEAVIGPDTLVTEEKTEAWRPLAQVIDLTGATPPGPAPAPAPRLALFSNGAALLLSLALIAAACIIAYRPGRSDPVAKFERDAEVKKGKLERSIAACGSKMQGYAFDIRRTSSELTPYEADMTFRYHDECDGEQEVQALFRCRKGEWRTVSIVFYKLTAREPPPGASAQVPLNLVYDVIGHDADTKIIGGLKKS
jgi:hypothetical protein